VVGAEVAGGAVGGGVDCPPPLGGWGGGAVGGGVVGTALAVDGAVEGRMEVDGMPAG